MNTQYLKLFIAFLGLFCASPSFAENPEFGLQGEELDWLWGIPFVGILLSLAILPLIIPQIWHHHYGKIAFCWALAVIIPMIAYIGFDVALYEVLSTYLHHFLPFIILIFALYSISGGIRLHLSTPCTPLNNTCVLIVGAFVASWIGTTGAAMLFIRPLLEINNSRTYRTHTVIFFIFLVCNVGGALTALGDPPLFLGFLNGVDFFWPTLHLALPMSTILLSAAILYYGIDCYYYKKETRQTTIAAHSKQPKIRIGGLSNVYCLLGAISAVLMSGLWDPNISFDIYHVSIKLQDIIRDIILIVLSLISLKFGCKDSRVHNAFTWEPFLEVLKIFAAIFITAAPVIVMLKAGENGAFANIVSLVNTSEGPNNQLYFWITGILSAFLDNAPTYLVFFNLAGGNAQILMGDLETTLIAISAGAVFMGALTYIGNAPNFMVKSIAETKDITMPSFIGYMVWSCTVLLPLFAFVSFVFL